MTTSSGRVLDIQSYEVSPRNNDDHKIVEMISELVVVEKRTTMMDQSEVVSSSFERIVVSA